MEAKLRMGPECTKESTFCLLAEAVENGDLNTVREFLNQGVDPSEFSIHGETLMELALAQNHLEVIKLLVQYKSVMVYSFFQDVFKMDDADSMIEIMSYIIEFRKCDEECMMSIYFQLTESEFQGPAALEILKLLLDNGLNVDDCISDTPVLHQAVFKNRIDFVKLLIKSGADINLKAFKGYTPLHVAVMQNNEQMVELLLKNQALVNEKSENGETVLHLVARNKLADIMILILLIKNNVDFNILDDKGKSPLEDSEMFLYFAIQYIAKFSVKFSQPVCKKNLQYLRKKKVLNKLNECLDELKRMKEHKVYDGILLYNFLESENFIKKLTFLTKKKDFVASFWMSWNRELFKNYQKDLDRTFEEAVRNRDILQLEEEKMKSIFKDILPDLFIQKVAYFNKEYLFFKQ